MKHLSTTLLTIALLTLSIAIWAQQVNLKVWNARLALPEYKAEPSRHTPRHSDGTLLPPIITADLHLTPSDNPVLITVPTHINAGITVTADPDTNFFAHEFAQLTISGTLNLNGTMLQPINLTTNEIHPLNQTWGGIVVASPGIVSINHAVFSHATPAVSCLPGSQVTVNATNIQANILGLFTASSNCTVTNSIIRSTRDGVIAYQVEPNIVDTRIFAANDDIVKRP